MTMPASLHTFLDPALRQGLIDAETAARIRHDVQANRTDPVRAISLRGRVPSSSIFQAVAADRGVDFITKEQLVLRRELLGRIPAALVQRKNVLPLQETERHIVCAVADVGSLTDPRLHEALRQAFDKPIRLALADPAELRPFIEQALHAPQAAMAGPLAEDAVSFVAEMMREAYVRRASDIHIEPHGRHYRIRVRVDGELDVLRESVAAPLAQAALSRLKVLAQMDIAENREPQDGSLVYELPEADGRSFDIRIATAPTKHGERATLRLLGTDSRALTLSDLGFSPAMHTRFEQFIQQPSGLLLLTGPTGSGKSTTLYAALRHITRPGLNVMTVEDPVEYSIPGVSQIEVDGFGKVTFSSALRSLLRHDPDVLMVGEIRDKETADMALRAAVTGHLVFSTLHTSTAVGAVTRLVDMDCEPYTVASTLLAVISQRLVRRLCPVCKTARAMTQEEAAFLGVEEATAEVFVPRGCVRCQRTGFLGRIAVFEIFQLDEAAREMIARGNDEKAIARSAKHLTTLQKDAMEKVLAGVTTIDEVRQVMVLES
jgi:type IV pilus assembly protein PilB